jgi:hypothetical protein
MPYDAKDPLGVHAVTRSAYRYFDGKHAVGEAREKGKKATEKKKKPKIEKRNYIDAIIGVKG